jgi:hypothetical protein
MGIWTGTSFSSGTVTDVNVDGSPVGVYLEHFTTNATFRNMHVGPNVATGVNCEWADPAWGGKPGCNGDVIENSTFDTTRAGVYLDQGTTGTTVRDSVFLHQGWAGIGDYLGVGNSYSRNNFAGVGSGAVAVSTNHI